MSRWVTASRALTAVGLLALVVLGLPGAPAPGEPLRLDTRTPRDTVAAILARDAEAALTWIDSFPPARDVAALLAGAAWRGADVTLSVPARAGGLRVEAPDRPVAGRRAALRIGVRAEPETVVLVTIEGAGGGIDTVGIATGPDGRGAAAVAVEPAREGAASWTVRSPGAVAVTHAWVRPPRPVRVLVWGGPPDSESRYLVRALEAAGMEVAVRQELGRGLAVASRGAAAPATLDDLAGYDVVVRTGPRGEAADPVLLRWVRERGGGLLVAGPLAPSSPLSPWAPRGAGTERAASEIEWEGPAELVPLPGAEIPARSAELPPGGIPVARRGGAPLVHLAFLGRGRLLASGLESWPWVLRAGLVPEHRAFWESVVEWLADGLTEETILVAEPSFPGARGEGRLEGDVPDAVLLSGGRPGAITGDALPVARSSDGTGRVAFVPTDVGAVTFLDRADDTTPVGAVSVDPGEPLGWTAAARRIGRAGGRIAPRGGPGAGAMAPGGEPGAPERAPRRPIRPPWLPWLLFGALGASAVGGWTLRRVQGLR